MRFKLSLLASSAVHGLFISLVLLFPLTQKKEDERAIVVRIDTLRVEKQVLPRQSRDNTPKIKKRLEKRERKVVEHNRRPAPTPKRREVEKPQREKPLKEPPEPAVTREETPQHEEELETTQGGKEPKRQPLAEYREAPVAEDYPVGLGNKEDEEEYKEEFLKENLSVISELIRSYLTYPVVARRMGWEGRVVVSFRLLPDGRIEDIRIEESSGYEVLDRNTLRVVRLASGEFPKPDRPVEIRLPVVYRLE